MSLKSVILVCSCGYKRQMSSNRMFSKTIPKCTRCGDVLNELTKTTREKRCLSSTKKAGRPRKTTLPTLKAKGHWQKTECRDCGKKLSKMNQNTGLCFACQGKI